MPGRQIPGIKVSGGFKVSHIKAYVFFQVYCFLNKQHLEVIYTIKIEVWGGTNGDHIRETMSESPCQKDKVRETMSVRTQLFLPQIKLRLSFTLKGKTRPQLYR